MAENSKIEWTDHTFNPWLGCTKVSPACDHCYAENWAKRTGSATLWQGERRRTRPEYWRQPPKWNAAAREAGSRARVFCASLADVFDNQVPPDWRGDLWALIAATPDLDWLLLTKRPQNILKMLPEDWAEGRANVWLGTTVENRTEAARRLPHLLAAPARKHFLSCEPLLGPLYLPDGSDPRHRIDWVIAGGESGPNARPTQPEWVQGVRDRCGEIGAAFFFKQWGEWIGADDAPAEALAARRSAPRREAAALRIGRKAAGRALDGRTYDAVPG